MLICIHFVHWESEHVHKKNHANYVRCSRKNDDDVDGVCGDEEEDEDDDTNDQLT